MEKGSFTGSICAIFLLCGGVLAAGGNLLAFVDPPAAIIIGGGIVCALMISFPLEEVKRVPHVVKLVFFYKSPSVLSAINEIVAIADVARREGVLALDSRLEEYKNAFLKQGLRLVVDGASKENVEAVLSADIEAVRTRHAVGAEMVSTLGKAAPVFGLVATLMGLAMMLADMDPDTIGEKMSVAILGTFYGATSANLFLLPFGAKLRFFNKKEIEIFEVYVEGILDIQKGENPRLIKTKLMTRLPERLRPAEDDEVAAA